MKIPKHPPDFMTALTELNASVNPLRGLEVVKSEVAKANHPHYYHWDKLVHLKPPEGFTHTEWWVALKIGRKRLSKPIPLIDETGRPFQFLIPDPIPEALHRIDLSAGGKIGVPDQVVNPATRDEYYVSSLIEEAITSSQLEGASTTRAVAQAMIRTARRPRDRSEQMIFNNFRAMQKIAALKNEPLTKELMLELHEILMHEAIDKPDAVGRFRLPDEKVVVGDDSGQVFHVPPRAEQLEARIALMCDFANGHTPGYFIHPVIRAIILHFWFAYDHPFFDGNGRTARALFYWSMLHSGYWLCEFISISHIIRKAPVQYDRAFLYTETDENDLTYFIVYHIEVLQRALQALDAYIEEKSGKLANVERQLKSTVLLNHRQRALIAHALRHPHFLYSTAGHKLSHGVAYQTARTDLIDLQERSLLDVVMSGRTWYFRPAADLAERLAQLS